MKIGRVTPTARGNAAARRADSSIDLGPGMSVTILRPSDEWSPADGAICHSFIAGRGLPVCCWLCPVAGAGFDYAASGRATIGRRCVRCEEHGFVGPVAGRQHVSRGRGTEAWTDEMNVLLITLDQFRGDCLSAAGHPVVKTPSLDRLAEGGVRLARHYSQAAPCGPGRACLYTGTYQLNNRVVGNGTPLDDRFDNVARRGPSGWVRADHLRVRRPEPRSEARRRGRGIRACRTIRASRRGSR